MERSYRALAFYQLDRTHPPAVSEEQTAGFRVGDPEGWQLHAGVAFWIDARSLASFSPRSGLGASVGGIFLRVDPSRSKLCFVREIFWILIR